jgi:hypothetical protein
LSQSTQCAKTNHSNTLHSSNPLVGQSPCNDELSCKWYYYFKTIGNDPAILFKNDYIKKTQIVPPVCPKCPNCPGSGVCTDCGGKGGSGTSNKDSSSNVVSDTTNSAVKLGKDVVGGTIGLGKEVVGGTIGLGKEVVGGTVNLGKEVVGGTVNLGKEVVGDVTGIFKGDAKSSSKKNGGNDREFGYVLNGGSTKIDQYSYYGALQSKGGNFMPVTADFSSFRR